MAASWQSGMVEVVASESGDGRPGLTGTCAWASLSPSPGTATIKARCYREYGMGVTDDSGKYTCLYRPFHMIGLETGISVAAAVGTRGAHGLPHGLPRGCGVGVGQGGPEGGHGAGRGRGIPCLWPRSPARLSVKNRRLPLASVGQKAAVAGHQEGEVIPYEAVEYDRPPDRASGAGYKMARD